MRQICLTLNQINYLSIYLFIAWDYGIDFELCIMNIERLCLSTSTATHNAGRDTDELSCVI